MWEKEIQSFVHYLRIERGLSGHSNEAYLRDISKLATYLTPLDIPVEDIRENYRAYEVFFNSYSLKDGFPRIPRCISKARRKAANYLIPFLLMKLQQF